VRRPRTEREPAAAARCLPRHVGVAVAALLFCSAVRPAQSQHLSFWTGQGGGAFLTGGSGVRDPDSHALAIGALSLFGDRFRLRYYRGSLERDERTGTGNLDNDVDYHGFDGVLTRRLTHLPFDVALGLSRYEEGYLRHGAASLTFAHHWGPHVSMLRDLPLWRFISGWAELDVHYLPYEPRQVMAAVDVGLGVGF
jgi:hypothetical protein